MKKPRSSTKTATTAAKKGNFFKKMADSVKNSAIMADAVGSGEFTGCIDTGCLILNALVSGSIFGGIQNNKTTTLAGDPSTGKTFIAMSILNEYLKNNPEAGALQMDTESAMTNEMMIKRGIYTDRVILNEPITVEDFRDTVINTLDAYNTEEEKPSMMMILDSLGQLSTRAEHKYMEETDEKKRNTKDMTRERLIKACFRIIRRRLADAKVPMIVTNHIYSSQGGYGPAKVISGGSGLLYTADCILMLTKAKEEDKNAVSLIDKGKEYSGVTIKVNTYKSRLSRENKTVQIRVSYTKGLDKYYGLLPLAEKYGVITKEGNRYLLADGRKVFGKEINENPETIYTAEILAKIDEAAKKEFCYGEGEGPRPDEIDEVDVEDSAESITEEEQA
jgi:RecA/RadA recombinase